MKKPSTKFETICVKENMPVDGSDSHVLPIHATSAFTYENLEDSIDVFTGQKSGYVYSRFGNPTIASVEKKLAQLETIDIENEGACIMTGSGMSAISTLSMSLLESGDAILTQYNLYGGTTEVFKKILSKYGISVIFIDLEDKVAIEKSLEEHQNIKLIYFESPSNPTLNCLDISGIAEIAKKYNVLSAIDNTFCTSYLQRPFNFGIDFVVYSTTKYLNGHGNSIAGAIISKDENYRKTIWTTMKLLGTSCNAFDAWLLHNGLKTLTVRMDKHCSNAMTIAQFLESQPNVLKVNYPGLKSNKYHGVASQHMNQYGAMLSFEIEGGLEKAKGFMNKTQLCSITATLGNVDTLLLHPVTASHMNIDKEIREANGIKDGLIRISVGIENVDDLIEDIKLGLT
ncbi:MAG: aminotransferase class I/II-fold pyridoxal phosphate-dependent enzyme [Saprospiraceae bacterium]|nr:aminotransferase class I/II-fold pyridoxal phosphate-dependent enzyme [Bacteroidia bacterium]NNE14106.1 aminotransferase class I/II-fold pyridoxal phosphate-dependent enzyme [Saprospiraceae bacterium]NNL92804.1 aminotransferase class I/II-fold pyridoxal phosphate-dependent enzyme [Saprospiraceae bacterium]